MLAGLFALVLIADPIPSGCYAMPELCRQLTAATGVPHTMDVNVRDYPVYVSVKSGDPKRVEQLVATALHAQWFDDAGKMRLIQTKLVPNEDFAHFEAAFKKAAGSNKTFLALPIQDLYKMAPGETVRYGNMNLAHLRKWPAKAPHNPNGQDGIAVRRMAYGVFEFSGMQDANFSWLPDEVVKLLGDEVDKPSVDNDQRAEIKKTIRDLAKMKLDFSNLDKRDPSCDLNSVALPFVGKAISKDLVVALPDFSFFTTFAVTEGSGTVRNVLESYSMAIDWTASDGAVVGRLSNMEVINPSQAKRSVLARFLQSLKDSGVANVAALSEYVKTQRPASSNSWTDIMMLVLGGIVIDQEYASDYPHNVRFYTQLSDRDWSVLKSGQPFLASDLSATCQRLLRDLLLQSRRDLENNIPDPGFWPSLAPGDLVLTAQIVDEQVLIGFNGSGPDVYNVETSALNYDMRLKSSGREPLYQPAKRRKLEIKIVPRGSAPQTEPFTTGFSEVTPDPGSKRVAWQQLPPPIANRFGQMLERGRQDDRNGVGTPPPTAPLVP